MTLVMIHQDGTDNFVDNLPTWAIVNEMLIQNEIFQEF